jgi:diketogulonate reductase-like aldo/keto reductase
VSNFSVDQLRDARKALGKHPVLSNQVRYNLIDRTIETGLLAKSLCRITDCDPTGTIAEIARASGKFPVQIVINWCLRQDGVVAIPKGRLQEHILENCGASEWRMSPEQIAMLDTKIKISSPKLVRSICTTVCATPAAEHRRTSGTVPASRPPPPRFETRPDRLQWA